MSYQTLKIDRDGAVEILTLNRPEALNALSPEMVGEIGAYFTGLATRLDVRVVILRAAGRHFCAGADLGSVAFAEGGAGRAQRQMAMQKLYSGVVKAMRTCPQPIIALRPRRGLRRRTFVGPRRGRALRRAERAHERRLYPRRPRRLRHGRGLSAAAPRRPLQRLRVSADGRFIDANRALAHGARQRDRSARTSCSRPASRSPPTC